jgi:hypothetical protein
MRGVEFWVVESVTTFKVGPLQPHISLPLFPPAVPASGHHGGACGLLRAREHAGECLRARARAPRRDPCTLRGRARVPPRASPSLFVALSSRVLGALLRLPRGAAASVYPPCVRSGVPSLAPRRSARRHGPAGPAPAAAAPPADTPSSLLSTPEGTRRGPFAAVPRDDAGPARGRCAARGVRKWAETLCTPLRPGLNRRGRAWGPDDDVAAENGATFNLAWPPSICARARPSSPPRPPPPLFAPRRSGPRSSPTSTRRRGPCSASTRTTRSSSASSPRAAAASTACTSTSRTMRCVQQRTGADRGPPQWGRRRTPRRTQARDPRRRHGSRARGRCAGGTHESNGGSLSLLLRRTTPSCSHTLPPSLPPLPSSSSPSSRSPSASSASTPSRPASSSPSSSSSSGPAAPPRSRRRSPPTRSRPPSRPTSA